jgi:hypothetical protein
VTDFVEVLEAPTMAISPGARWTPVVREELTAFLEQVHPETKIKTRQETVRILAQGVEPGKREVSAGLVVGYVQSGKTTSFTAAAALARDNGFALVVIIAGTSTNLLDQTQERLQEDLRLSDKSAYRRWVSTKSPKKGSEEASKIEGALEEWLDADIDPDDRATVLITVMKQHRHLEWLVQTLEDVGTRLDLGELTALVIDDEADQASPNLKRKQGEESATYGRIRRLRGALPSHTLLEYTATPQATLLVSLVDELSPDFVSVIDPGEDYTGGRYFFQNHRREFIKHIPSDDVALIDDESLEPPPSLTKAFAGFALGCAAGRVLRSGPPQRSMLVHPSHKTLPQGRFAGWLKQMRDLWVDLLRSDEGDLDRQALLEDWLQPAYEDLVTSVAELPALEVLLQRLPGILKKTSVVEINATRGRPQPVAWSTGYSWILVGGQLLDRGFTVEGLTVTYMPRGLGVGNADTVQQRARFFGYKRSYAGFCRAWLDPEVDRAFSSYVDHEEAMRKELIEVATTGMPLKEWKRIFLLSKQMRLTRASVIRLDTSRTTLAKKWFAQQHFDGADESIFVPNRHLVDEFVNRHHFIDDEGDPGRLRETQVHPVAEVPLVEVLEGLLEEFVMTDDDAVSFSALRVLLAVAQDQGDELCRVHRMMAHSPARRRRGLDRDYRIKNLFQGSNAATGYRGDREVKSNDQVTVQLHRLQLRGDDGTEDGAGAHVIAEDVPVLAIWVPQRLDTSLILQRS